MGIWEDIEKIYAHIFKNELDIDAFKYNVLLTEPLIRKKTENFLLNYVWNFQSTWFIFCNSALLYLYSRGKYIRFVIDSGEGLTQFIIIFEGFLSHIMTKFDLSDGDITKYDIC